MQLNKTEMTSQCVKSCGDYPNFVEISNRCFEKRGDEAIKVGSYFQGFAEDLSRSWFSHLIVCCVAVSFSFLVLMLFRYAIKYVVWTVCIGIGVLLFLIGIGGLIMGIKASTSRDYEVSQSKFSAYFVGVVFLVLALIYGCVIYSIRKRIHLVSMLLKEASKALIDMPVIMCEPILTFISLAITFTLFIYFNLIIASSGRLKILTDQTSGEFKKAIFVRGGLEGTAFVINMVAFLWFTFFIIGCQHFVIAGAVSQWYFSRDKQKLKDPIKTSFSTLCRYHLGSICYGSLFIAFVKIIHIVLSKLKVSDEKTFGCENYSDLSFYISRTRWCMIHQTRF
jgi:solute carrier family 44 (choline transporter-like protein), member 1